MATFDWTYDSDVGILKNHELSQKLLEQSLGACKVMPFTQDYGFAFGKNRGETINVMHIQELADPTSAELEESTKIPIDKISMGTRSFTVVEYGRGVEYTSLSEQLSQFTPQQLHQKTLMRQMERAMDTTAANAFMSTDVKLVCTPSSATALTWAVTGTTVTAATHKLNFDHCTAIVDYMADTIHIPPYEGEDYIGLSCNKNLRSLKQDRLWQAVHLYLQKGDFFYRGEMGKTERIRWVEINRSAAFSNTSGSSSLLGEAVVFGDEAVARIEVETPHLRVDPNYQNDFGRTKACAWYGILTFGSVWDTATDGEAKIVKIAST
jgi:N4-gp56 family major capsid protein